MLKIERLANRDIREGLKHPRKKTWKFTIGKFSVIITIISNPRYTPLFNKNIIAFNIIEEYKLPGPRCFLALKKPLKIWIASNVGKNLLEVVEKSQASLRKTLFKKAIECLISFNQARPVRMEKIKIPRYLKLFKEQIKLQESQEFFPNFSKLYHLLKKTNIQIPVGLGIEDPVVSNFAIKNSSKVFLVDFDNFKTNIPFYYEVGFLEADARLESVFEKEAFLETKKKTKDNLNAFLHTLGVLSRYCIAYLNVKRNPNFDYGISTTTARQKIEKLSFLLQREKPFKFS